MLNCFERNKNFRVVRVKIGINKPRIAPRTPNSKKYTNKIISKKLKIALNTLNAAVLVKRPTPNINPFMNVLEIEAGITMAEKKTKMSSAEKLFISKIK